MKIKVTTIYFDVNENWLNAKGIKSVQDLPVKFETFEPPFGITTIEHIRDELSGEDDLQ